MLQRWAAHVNLINLCLLETISCGTRSPGGEMIEAFNILDMNVLPEKHIIGAIEAFTKKKKTMLILMRKTKMLKQILFRVSWGLTTGRVFSPDETSRMFFYSFEVVQFQPFQSTTNFYFKGWEIVIIRQYHLCPVIWKTINSAKFPKMIAFNECHNKKFAQNTLE